MDDKINFKLDQDQAEFYVDLLYQYNADRERMGYSRDFGVSDDENWLRKEMEIRDWTGS